MLSYSLKQAVRHKAHVFLLLSLLASPIETLASSGQAVSLSWDASTDATVAGYNVYYGTASRAYTNVISVGSSTSIVISNLSSGTTYFFAATTHTAFGTESEYSDEAAYSVPGTNFPPTLNVLTNLTLSQDAGEQVVALTGISSGSSAENQSLSVSAFSSNPGLIQNPQVAYTSPNTNGTLSFSPAPGSFGTAIITVMVDDGGTISNTVIRSFTVTVVPADAPPTIDLLPDLVINQNSGNQIVNLTGISGGTTNPAVLTVTATCSNPSLISTLAINYISPANVGTLSFAPAANASGKTKITITVSDTQPTNNSTSISFNLTINPTNAITGLLTNAIIAPNSTFSYLINPPATYLVSQPVSSGDKFSISLASGAPAGARISTRKGVSRLIWTPTFAQASTTNLMVLQIVDTSNSAVSTNQMLQVIVEDYLSVALGSTSVQAGQNASVPVSVSSSDGVTNLSFTVPWPGSSLSSPSLSISAPGVASSSLRSQNGSVLVSVQMSPGKVLQNSNVIGSISFLSSSTQPSGYVTLPIKNLTASKPSAAPYSNLIPTSGQVAVVNNLAILQPATAPTGIRTLTVLGRIGNTYQIQYCTNFSSSTAWTPLTTYSQTNISQTFILAPGVPQGFYRVQQR